MELKEIKLKFTEEDFNQSYYLTKTCAITKALNRCGYNWFDVGTKIIDKNGNVIIDNSNPTYVKLIEKVLDGYFEGGNRCFEHTLIF